jgi:hypothetical protein
MAHAAPPPPGHARRVQIVGAVAVVLGVVLLAVTVVSLTRSSKRDAGHTSQSASASEAPSVVTSDPSPGTPASTVILTPTPTFTPTPTPARIVRVPLVVANNTARTGIAATAATRFQAQGWQVSDLVDVSGDIVSTCAYYDPANPAALPAAQELQREFPAIKRVEPRFAGLPAAPIVVVLTSDYS